MRRLVLGAVTLLIAASSLPAATVSILTIQSPWNQSILALTGLTKTETFDIGVFESWLSITTEYPGEIANSQWESRVQTLHPPNLVDTFRFDLPGVYAVGGFWNLADPLGPGEGIAVWADINGTDTYIGTIDGHTKNFWGFVVTGGTFTNMVLKGAGGGYQVIQETYWLDDLSVAYVPEPATTVLLGVGLLLLAVRRR